MVAEIFVWVFYLGVLAFLAYRGRGHDVLLSGSVGFGVQALAYVATYISAVALVGFAGLAHKYGLQMLLIAAGNVWLGTYAVYKFLAWPTRRCQQELGARTPAHLLALGHGAPRLRTFLGIIFALFLGVYASAVIKGAAMLLMGILPLPFWLVVWAIAGFVGLSVYIGGLRGVLYTEAFQGAVMLVGILLIMLAIFDKVDGPFEGMRALAALPPTKDADQGFLAFSTGGQGMFIFSLMMVTSVAVWAQPQMMQRHFALKSAAQAARCAPLAMLVLTVLVGGTYFVASLSRLIIPSVASPDEVMPLLVNMLLPDMGRHLFVLAIVSASLSTASALYHIAVAALAEDVPGRRCGTGVWFFSVLVCIVVSASCAQLEGQIIAMLCTTSWSIIGATALVPYLALALGRRSHARAAWASVLVGFFSCLGWYVLAYAPTALVSPVFGQKMAAFPPFFVGIFCSLLVWFVVYSLCRQENSAKYIEK